MNYLEHFKLPDSSAFNSGLTVPSPAYMELTFGWPRPKAKMTADCMPVLNKTLAARMHTVDVGSFRVTAYDLFAEALQRIFAKVKVEKPQLYPLVGTAGALCCRFIRGTHVPSNHSWGAALDLKVGGILVPLGADWTLRGLLELYPYFHAEKLYSGMGYKHRKDSMHFETSEELIEEWKHKHLI